MWLKSAWLMDRKELSILVFNLYEVKMCGKCMLWPYFSPSVKWDQGESMGKPTEHSERKMLQDCGTGKHRQCERKRHAVLPKGRFLRAAHSGQRQAAGRPQQLALLQAGGQAVPAVLCNEHNSNTDSVHS